VRRITIGDKALELPGEVSTPVRVDFVDTFPPAVPQGLAAVLVPEEKTIDLSWQPDTEPDLAGYIVYRTENDTGWHRISGQPPIPSPAYRDTSVEPGHSYRYAVTAIDQTGHESERSSPTTESVPNP
jgi:fibronectin type 3 domain-containing protein